MLITWGKSIRLNHELQLYSYYQCLCSNNMRISRRDKFASIYFAYIQEYLNDTPSYKDTNVHDPSREQPHPTPWQWSHDSTLQARGLDNTETSKNQRLRRESNNDRRSTCFCSSTVLCISFMWQNDSQNMCDQITSDRRSKCACSRCVLCIPYILSGSPNECLLHTCDSCIITTWRLGLLTFHLLAHCLISKQVSVKHWEVSNNH